MDRQHTLPVRDQRLNRENYKLFKKLGEGHFGKVYLAQCSQTKSHVAMKVQEKVRIRSEKDVQFILHEQQIMKELDSIHVVKLLATFHTEKRIYFIMDFVSEDNFSTFTKKVTLRPEHVEFYMAQLFLGIEYIHSKDISHRDLKKANMLLSLKGHVKICDFGLAKRGMGPGTTTRTVCGSLSHMAPEIHERRGYTRSVDWWAFGVILIELLTNSNPFITHDTAAFVRTYPFPEMHFPGMPSDAYDLASNLLRHDSKRMKPEDIARHEFFSCIDWDGLEKGAVEPPFTNKDDVYLTTEVEIVEDDCESVVLRNGRLEPFQNFEYISESRWK
ncbi:hypothetical protein GCK72_025063 [Caenorhabditis remanei]|uniref:Protein kinase domain-containing protein n=1 Tax=Caenorhabditis remanei TaxID=31234 RepID=A0A6A5G0W7_CAERE|nr:hypothetical protein GCK72_025063 [Caenorhabditis remanei]KAF1748596.1 hypothetical protein GCK72_025063 [Caenorhabditis remanei]